MCTKRGTQFHYVYAPAIICFPAASPRIPCFPVSAFPTGIGGQILSNFQLHSVTYREGPFGRGTHFSTAFTLSFDFCCRFCAKLMVTPRTVHLEWSPSS